MIYVYILSESWALKASLSHACKLFSTATRVGFFNTNKYSEDSQRRALSGQEVNKHWRAHTSLHTFRCERGLELTLPRNGWEGNHWHRATAEPRQRATLRAGIEAGSWALAKLQFGWWGWRTACMSPGLWGGSSPVPSTHKPPAPLCPMLWWWAGEGGSGNYGCTFLQWWIKTMSNRAWEMAQAGSPYANCSEIISSEVFSLWKS